MKKFLFMGVLTLAIICGACQGKTSAVVSDVDTVKVDSIKVDSVVTDTIEVANDSIVCDTVSVL